MIRFWRRNGATYATTIIVGAFAILALSLLLMSFLPFGRIIYSDLSDNLSQNIPIIDTKPKVTHIETPESVKAIYITSCTASVPSLRDKVLPIIEDTELNSLVIDVKDYTGTISYASTTVSGYNKGKGCKIYDLPEFIDSLHQLGIYVIARITVFQDPLYAYHHKELAVQSKNRPDDVWKDRNGLAYIDPGAKPYWDYIVNISKEAYSIGFDEINFDYIRFPSDGNMVDVSYLYGNGRPKSEVLREFFSYLRDQLSTTSIPISADLFGLTTSAEGDLGIGQVLEDALTYFDFVSPMVYPSHFAKGFNGIANPAEFPYEVVKYSMDKAWTKAVNASTSPQKLRPWLQDFNLGAKYTPAMVRAQIQATYDAGLNSFMLWNASSVYQKSTFTEGQ